MINQKQDKLPFLEFC